VLWLVGQSVLIFVLPDAVLTCTQGGQVSATNWPTYNGTWLFQTSMTNGSSRKWRAGNQFGSNLRTDMYGPALFFITLIGVD